MTRTSQALGSPLLLAAAACVALASSPPASAYCLTGVRWPDASRPAPVLYNASGKSTSGQCITSSQMDSAALEGIAPWRALRHAGSTPRQANKRDGVNVLGWANLGGQTLGITNYLRYDPYRTVPCGGNSFSNLHEADVRLSSRFRWTSGQGTCPCVAGSAFYLNAVSAHEFGHVIGLCHTPQPSSLMYPSFGTCQNKAKGTDEAAGENALCY